MNDAAGAETDAVEVGRGVDAVAAAVAAAVLVMGLTKLSRATFLNFYKGR